MEGSDTTDLDYPEPPQKKNKFSSQISSAPTSSKEFRLIKVRPSTSVDDSQRNLQWQKFTELEIETPNEKAKSGEEKPSSVINLVYVYTREIARTKKPPKTTAERSRAYRLRKKLLKEQEKGENKTEYKPDSQDDGSGKEILPSPKGKKNDRSSASRTRRWRERKKLACGLDTRTIPAKEPKTAAQRMREYRARKKEKLESESDAQLCNTILIDSDSENDRGYDDRIPGNHSYLNKSLFIANDYNKHKKAHEKFDQKFLKNPFGYACTVCDRLWFKQDLKTAAEHHEEILKKITNIKTYSEAMLCATCKVAIDRKKVPALSTYNGFKYPEVPSHLPKLDLVSERLISPRLPFLQIRRLRHMLGPSGGIYSQAINVPVSNDTMVNHLPRIIDDDYSFNVHICNKRIHKSGFIVNLINRKNIKAWLRYLAESPLCKFYNISIDDAFLRDSDEENEEAPTVENMDEISEDIPDNDECLSALQHTLLWNEEKSLKDFPLGLLSDDHAEELSFPTIYLGQFREFKEDVRLKATPFKMASSELRRRDRRGISPDHLLFVAMKIMRLRIRHSLSSLKHVGSIASLTATEIDSEDYINSSIESNLDFLRTIPNSTWFWKQRKEDVFAIIRQSGRPNAFMTLSSNEIERTDLIQLLYKLANNGKEISKRAASALSRIQKLRLINDDAVTCAIYFSKLVNVLMNILQSIEFSPFCRYRVARYFKRIEFQDDGSPQARILLWLENTPDDMLGKDYCKSIRMIDSLVSVSSSQASGNIKLQIHKHSSICYKNSVSDKPQKCRFEAPYMPCRTTMILTPMQESDPHYSEYSRRYAEIQANLESNDYKNIDDFYEKNLVWSEEEYINILRAGIAKPQIFYKRNPEEKWHNPFNPFLLDVARSNMEFQIIPEDHSCAAYVMEYVNQTDRGISELRRKVIEVMNEHPEFNLFDITEKMSVDMANSVEMTSQEAAWYLLREPLAKSSVPVIYIDTALPAERQRTRKTQKEFCEEEDNSAESWKEDWFDKYEKRPKELEHVTLARFVAKYFKNKQGLYVERKEPRVLRYRKYDISLDHAEYRREMVTLHIPYRNEQTDILDGRKFINIYQKNEDIILERVKEFESNVDMEKLIEMCRHLPVKKEGQTRGFADRPTTYPSQELHVYLSPKAHDNENLPFTEILTPAQRAKRYREKRKLDEVREKAFRDKEKERDARRRKINELTPEERDNLRKKWRKWDRAKRARRMRNKAGKSTDGPDTGETSSTSSEDKDGQDYCQVLSSRWISRLKQLDGEQIVLAEALINKVFVQAYFNELTPQTQIL